jgi:hypothetical protein
MGLPRQFSESDPEWTEESVDRKHTYAKHNISNPLCQVCAKISKPGGEGRVRGRLGMLKEQMRLYSSLWLRALAALENDGYDRSEIRRALM